MNTDTQAREISPTIREGLRKVTRQIVEQFHPQKVILFGSYYASKEEWVFVDHIPAPVLEVLTDQRRN